MQLYIFASRAAMYSGIWDIERFFYFGYVLRTEL